MADPNQSQTLETGHDAGPVSEQYCVRHEVQCNISVREQVYEITD